MQHRFPLACPRILVVCYYYDRPISLAVGNLIVFVGKFVQFTMHFLYNKNQKKRFVEINVQKTYRNASFDFCYKVACPFKYFSTMHFLFLREF